VPKRIDVVDVDLIGRAERRTLAGGEFLAGRAVGFLESHCLSSFR
jgi:hypothetical protein